MGALSGALCGVVTQLQGLALPAAIIGILIAILGIFLVPVMGEAVASARGTIRSILVATAFLGLLPALISGMAAIGGFGGSGCALAGPLNVALHAAPPALGMAVLLPVGLRVRRWFVRACSAAEDAETAEAPHAVV